MKSALAIVQHYHPGVTKVVDAKRSHVVSVTSRDSRASKSKAPEQCAMAKACQREYDGAIISLSVAYLVKGKTATRYKVPQSVTREIVSFDRNHNFAPGEYKLTPPNKGQRLGPRQSPQPLKPKTKYVRSKKRNHKTSGVRSLRDV